MKKIIITLLVILTLAGGIVLSTAHVNAQGVGGIYSSLVQKIADRFGLNKADVQAVFDTERKDKRSQMETNFEEKLNRDVKDGKITESQKQLIITKRKELETNRQNSFDSWKNMTPQQRKAAMQKQKEDLQTWASQNGIDLKYLFPGMGRKGFGRGMHTWAK